MGKIDAGTRRLWRACCAADAQVVSGVSQRGINRILDDVDALESQLAEALARIEALTNALKMISPLMNNLEAKLLIGDEACIWAAEIVRDALRTPPPARAAKG